ncbi:hypothetical protein COT42_02555 [Candidatus Saganbacteria bacterium CG08_land_8_20_14_0_20_45_16]|uniref:UPF0235 protein COT42_02555 n=1 Tax=Candidatus Saganbacteria bacterium CG08_land_8_20_14_0_20_45_16 TaxID=2014293 RepID=A0A2H0XZP0_UNCSA|nr:MAG: hypothetical protein COT42_02555 [Candidatus Saganbacteria bacterium CG08_land_8_20_14_0_20_45_16]
MRLNIRVIPNAKQDRLAPEGDCLKIYLTAPPVDGKSNKFLIRFLAEHFSVKRGQLKIVRGASSRDKVIELSSF